MTSETTGAFPVPSEELEEDEEDKLNEVEDEDVELEELRGEAALAGLSRTMKRMPLLGSVKSTTRFSSAAAKAAARAAPGSVTTVGEEGLGGAEVETFALAAVAAADADAGSSVAAESSVARRVGCIDPSPLSARQT